MVARRRHDEMEVSIRFSAVALRHHRLKRGRRLFESDPSLVGRAAEFEESQPHPEQAVSVTVKIEAELCGEDGRTRGQNTIAPDHCPRLTPRDEPAAQPPRLLWRR